MEKLCAPTIQKKESGYKRMLKELFLSHPYSLIALLLLSALSMLFSLITPLIMRSLIDDVLIDKNIEILAPVLIGLSLVYVISAGSNFLSGYLKGKLNILLFKELSAKIFGKIQSTSLKEIHALKIGDLLSRTTGNVNATIQILTILIPDITIAVLGIILPSCIMLSLNVELTLIVMSPVILFVISSKYFGNTLKIKQRKALDTSADMNSFIKEAYSIIPLIKVFGLERWMHERLDHKMKPYYDASLDVVTVSSLSSSIGLLIYGVPSILVLTFGSLAVLNDSMSLGTLTAFMGYVALFFSPIQRLSTLWTSYKGSMAAYDRICEILSLDGDFGGNNRLMPDVRRIEFDGVWFSYDNRIILKNFHASFTKGLNYIIGDNGSGKTTIIKLLSGLYRPDRGRILIEGQDSAQISRDALRAAVSVVFSDPLVFDGTIYDNIHIGNTESSKEDVFRAAKKAELHNFVMKLPRQYETEVGESGLNLSSGEKQKIALARVVLRDTPIIVFDEFTRSIDYESKKSIYSVIRQFHDKIVIIITHDLNDIESGCNCIYLEKNGWEERHDSCTTERMKVQCA